MQPRRILLVDDDPDTRALVKRAIEQEFPGADIREATDKASLDEVLAGWAPDILVTDFDLRWWDGLKVFDHVKAASPHCCTIMFTGTGDEELAVKAMKHGFDDYVVKRATQLRRMATSARMAYERHHQHRQLAENRDLVLKELYHRLHNNLQIVISLLRMTERAVADPNARQHLADLSRRIQALTTLQEEFYRSEDFRQVDFSAYLGRLAQNLVGVSGGRVRLMTEIEPVTLPVDLAVPLGLIANEWMTNVLKHAFPEPRTGQLIVRLDPRQDGLDLQIRDDGVGKAAPRSNGPGGLGERLVERLATQIDAEVAVEFSGSGTTCTVRLPL